MGPYTFTVTTDPDVILEVAEGREVAGVSNLGFGIIGIREEAVLPYKQDTLLHELIHMAFRVSGYEFKVKSQEEPVVLAIATALLDCLQTNPDLITYLTYRD